MSYRIPDGSRASARVHPDEVLFDPRPGKFTQEAWSAVLFDRHLLKLAAVAKATRLFEAQKKVSESA